MKTITMVLKSIFTCFSSVAFLFIGLLATFCSAVIEWYVLKEILKIPGWDVNATNWAGLIILILEGTKFTLHFYGKVFKRKDLKSITELDVKKMQKLIAAVKNGLVIFSLICSVICVTNILYYDNQTKIEKYIQQNEADCDRNLKEKINQLIQEKKEEEKNLIAAYDDERKEIKEQRKILKKILKQISEEVYINRREDLQEEADAIRVQMNKIRNNYFKHVREAQQIAEKNYDKKRNSVEKVYGENGSARVSNTDEEAIQEGDNPYLRTFLLAISKTLFGTGYSREAYFLCALFISFIVAAALEFCIVISQWLLTMKTTTLMEIVGDVPKIENGKKAVHVGVFLLFSVFLSMAIYFIASIILQSQLNIKEIRLAFFTYVGTVLLFNAFTPSWDMELISNLARKSERIKGAYSIFEKIVKNALVPSAISFVLYFLLGFFIDGAINFGDMAGFAIAIGGTVAKVVRFDQCNFLI